MVNSYRTMYEKSIDVMIEKLIFRPMLPNSDDILFSGTLKVPVTHSDNSSHVTKPELDFENAHLTCFAGGMFALGARIFERPEDLEIAKKLTEGCVWSYNATTTGIMPESFFVIGCENQNDCKWNQTKYEEAIDPWAEGRASTYQESLGKYQADLAAASSSYAKAMAAATAAPKIRANEGELVENPEEAEAEPTLTPEAGLKKRQLDTVVEEVEELPKVIQKTEQILKEKLPTKDEVYGDQGEEAEAPEPTTTREEKPSLPHFPALYSPRVPLTHKEFVQNRIQEERLPPGIVSIQSKKYILR